MPSPKGKGIAFGQRRRTYKNGPAASAAVANKANPPRHPGASYKKSQNAKEAARKGMNAFEMKRYVRSKSKSAPAAAYRALSPMHRRELNQLRREGYNTRAIINTLRANPHATSSRLTRGLNLRGYYNNMAIRSRRAMGPQELRAALAADGVRSAPAAAAMHPGPYSRVSKENADTAALLKMTPAQLEAYADLL